MPWVPSLLPCLPIVPLQGLIICPCSQLELGRGRQAEEFTSAISLPPQGSVPLLLDDYVEPGHRESNFDAISFLRPPQSPLPRWASPTSVTTVAGATNSRVPWRSTRSGATTTCRVSALKPKLWLANQVGYGQDYGAVEGRARGSTGQR